MSDIEAKATVNRDRVSTRFTERLNGFLRRVTHRCASTRDDFDNIFSTRYLAYRRQNIIDSIEYESLFDPEYDFTRNSFLTIINIDSIFASTFRVHVARHISEPLPSRRVFGDLIDPYLGAGLTVVDPTRLAARLEASRAYSELPFVALRPAWLAAEHFSADIVLATVAIDHTQFYKRVFGYRTISEPRDYPKSAIQDRLSGAGFPSSEKRS
jgi:hypothetical protein